MLAALWHNPGLMRTIAAALTGLALLGIAAGGIYWLTHRAVFSIRVIEVEAESGDDPATSPVLRHVNVPTMRAAALPRIFNATRLNFFTVDLETIRQAFEGVAWVRRARVSRLWPNRLRVEVEEHRVLGTWDNGRQADSNERPADAFVDTHGELFAVNPAEAEDDADEDGLPELSGPPGSERSVAARYRDFAAWFARLDLKPDQVSLSSRYAWSLHLLRAKNATGAQPAGDAPADPGLTVELGRETDSNTLVRRMTRLLAAYPLLTAKWPKPTSIDLRYPNGFALRAEGLRLADDSKKKIPTARKQPASAAHALHPRLH